MQGGIGYALSAALREEVTLTGGEVGQRNFDAYRPLRIDEMPEIEVHIVPSNERPSGVGEPGTPPVAPAVANALARPVAFPDLQNTDGDPILLTTDHFDIVPGARYAVVSTLDSAMTAAAILRCLLAGATLMPVDLRFETPKQAADRLIAAGHEVICMDNFFTGSRTNVTHLRDNPRFELFRGDVNERTVMEVDEVYHLACPASPIHYQHDPVQTTKTTSMTAKVPDEAGAATRIERPLRRGGWLPTVLRV